jgi:hypothetical protein
MARTVLENPPPLTPANQQDFPFLAWSFPFEALMQGAALAPRHSAQPPPPHNSAAEPVE